MNIYPTAKKFRKIAALTCIVLLMILISDDAAAQCAMCKKNVESNLQTGGSVGKSLNSGILYLMGIPYVLIASMIFIFFRKQIAEKMGWDRKKN